MPLDRHFDGGFGAIGEAFKEAWDEISNVQPVSTMSGYQSVCLSKFIPLAPGFSPGKFHAFQFGHPRENILSLLEEFTSKSNRLVQTIQNESVEHVLY
jgi:hypothetical protein